MRLQKKVVAIFDGTIGVLAILGCVLIVFMMLIVGTDVIMRYFLGRPMTGVIEIAEYSLMFVTFLGATWVLRREGHVRMDLVLNRLDSRNQAILNTITSIIGAIICLIAAWYGAETTWEYFQGGVYRVTGMRTPIAPIIAIIPIGFFLLFIQFLRRSRGFFVSWRRLGHKEQRRYINP